MAVRLALGAALVLATVAVYADVRTAGFLNLDDPHYVAENPNVLRGLTREGVEWAWTSRYTGNWHPLTWLSLMLDVEVFGPDPGALHLINLLLHCINAVGVFLLLTRWTGSPWRSGFVAGLFALHPLHVESVAWIAERKDVLSTLFWLGAAWGYGEYARGSSRRYYALSLLCMGLGLLAKPMLVSLPFVLLLFDVWPLERLTLARGLGGGRFGRLVAEKLPFLALSLGASVIALITQQSAGALRPLSVLPLTARLENAVVAYARYLGKALWPADLSIFYPYPQAWPVVATGGSLLLLVAVTVGVLRVRRSAPYALTGWLFFLVTLVPTLGLVQVGDQSLADRYTYLPLLGIFWTAAWGVPELLRSRAGLTRLLGPAALAALLACGFATWRYVASWQDSVTIFTHALASTSRNSLAHNHLGQALLDRGGDLERARYHLESAIRIEPTYAGAHLNSGLLHARLGETDAAIAAFRRALAFWPELPRAHFELARAYERKGNLDAAVAAYREGLRHQPEAVRAANQLGVLLGRLGRIDDALATFQRIVREEPRDFEAYENLGIVYELLGNAREAARSYRLALQRESRATYARERLAWILSTARDPALRDGSEAVELATQACRDTRFESPGPLDALAAAYAEAGAFDEAVETAARARAAAGDSGQLELADAIESRAALYRRGLPYRD